MYRTYVTDCLKIMINGNVRYADIVGRLKHPEERETESAESIIQRISNGLDRIGGKKENVNTEQLDGQGGN